MYLTINQTANLNDLGYLPIIPLQYIWGHITQKYNADYIESVRIIYQRVNYNISKWNSLPFIDTVDFDQVDAVINAYGNLAVSELNIEQWTPSKNKTSNQKNTLSLVASASGISEIYTEMILDQLYWATKDGDLVRGNWIRPREFAEYKEYRKQNEATEGNKWLETTFDWIKWILILGGIGVGAYILFNLVQTGKAISK